jgi:Zn ribbon nucleic-acid-binding protein
VTLADLQSIRLRLLERCAQLDRMAGEYREAGIQLPETVRMGFAALSELRAIEHQIAKHKEPKK